MIEQNKTLAQLKREYIQKYNILESMFVKVVDVYEKLELDIQMQDTLTLINCYDSVIRKREAIDTEVGDEYGLY